MNREGVVTLREGRRKWRDGFLPVMGLLVVIAVVVAVVKAR